MALELPDGWKDELPLEIKDSGVLKDITTIDQMATMVVNGRKLQSTQISIPSSDASPEARETFLKDLQTKVPDLVYVGDGADMGNIYDRMGRPGEATSYELGEIPDPLKDNLAGLAAKGHEAGLTGKQMKAVTDVIVGDFNERLNLNATAVEASKTELKTLFGEATDEKLQVAADFAKKLGFDDQFAGVIEGGTMGLANMKAFDKMMGGFDSPGPRIGDEPGADGFSHLTPGQAELKLSEIQNNKEHPYWATSGPAHDAAVKQYVELVRQADAGKVLSEADQFRDALLGRG